ncbi:MAG TPA: DUF433 domain-containing protein [Fimbriimonadaceae bacterium]|jgi:uncharacterized protein (DUF433 family)
MLTIDQSVRRDPEIMGGELCFAGTRVPVRILFDYLEGGQSLDYFLDGYPSVKNEQAVAVLDYTYKQLDLETLQAKSA